MQKFVTSVWSLLLALGPQVGVRLAHDNPTTMLTFISQLIGSQCFDDSNQVLRGIKGLPYFI